MSEVLSVKPARKSRQFGTTVGPRGFLRDRPCTEACEVGSVQSRVARSANVHGHRAKATGQGGVAMQGNRSKRLEGPAEVEWVQVTPFPNPLEGSGCFPVGRTCPIKRFHHDINTSPSASLPHIRPIFYSLKQWLAKLSESI